MQMKQPKFHEAHLGWVEVLQSTHALFADSLRSWRKICLCFSLCVFLVEGNATILIGLYLLTSLLSFPQQSVTDRFSSSYSDWCTGVFISSDTKKGKKKRRTLYVKVSAIILLQTKKSNLKREMKVLLRHIKKPLLCINFRSTHSETINGWRLYIHHATPIADREYIYKGDSTILT